jgi:hypothetical protein
MWDENVLDVKPHAGKQNDRDEESSDRLTKHEKRPASDTHATTMGSEHQCGRVFWFRERSEFWLAR